MKPFTAIWPGSSQPVGAHWDGEGVNFAVFSENAEAVDLCIFDPTGRRELQRIELVEDHLDLLGRQRLADLSELE